MGLRFRKSFKLAPGVKLNLGKRGVGLSVGGKYGGMSFNTHSGTRVRASAPGTGLSYSAKIGGGRKRSSHSSRRTAVGSSKPVCVRWWYITLAVLFFFAGIQGFSQSAGTAILCFVIAFCMGYRTYSFLRPVSHDLSLDSQNRLDDSDASHNP